MAGEKGKASRIEKFNGIDFGFWTIHIENYLYGKKPNTMKDEEWNLLDRHVLGVIQLTLLRLVVHNVVIKKTTVHIMKALFGIYIKPSANNKVHLMKKFNLKKAKDTPVVQHLNEFNMITNQVSLVEIEFDDEICALILLAFLPNNCKAMRMAVSNSTRKSKFKYDNIRDLILGEEVRRRDANIDNAQDQSFCHIEQE